ncbi:hypothetical protein BH20ACT18_BH20ACT18_12210 [soil metagenome]
MRDTPLCGLEGSAAGERLAVVGEGRGDGGAEAGLVASSSADDEPGLVASSSAEDEPGDEGREGEKAQLCPSPGNGGRWTAVAHGHAGRLAHMPGESDPATESGRAGESDPATESGRAGESDRAAPLNADLYERAYRTEGEAAEHYGRWRALGARAKADHVVELARRAGRRPRTLLEVGCGDGALLLELARRGFVAAPDGVEISTSAVKIAGRRPELGSVAVFDGERIPAADEAYDLGVLSHVLEHVADPGALLAETARACRAVIVEVPLELNLSARRASKRGGAAEVGHVQDFDRASARALATDWGFEVLAELGDPLAREVHTFVADTPAARFRGSAKAAARHAVFSASQGAAERLFTIHYAYFCEAPGRRYDAPTPT